MPHLIKNIIDYRDDEYKFNFLYLFLRNHDIKNAMQFIDSNSNLEDTLEKAFELKLYNIDFYDFLIEKGLGSTQKLSNQNLKNFLIFTYIALNNYEKAKLFIDNKITNEHFITIFQNLIHYNISDYRPYNFLFENGFNSFANIDGQTVIEYLINNFNPYFIQEELLIYLLCLNIGFNKEHLKPHVNKAIVDFVQQITDLLYSHKTLRVQLIKQFDHNPTQKINIFSIISDLELEKQKIKAERIAKKAEDSALKAAAKLFGDYTKKAETEYEKYSKQKRKEEKLLARKAQADIDYASAQAAKLFAEAEKAVNKKTKKIKTAIEQSITISQEDFEQDLLSLLLRQAISANLNYNKATNKYNEAKSPADHARKIKETTILLNKNHTKLNKLFNSLIEYYNTHANKYFTKLIFITNIPKLSVADYAEASDSNPLFYDHLITNLTVKIASPDDKTSDHLTFDFISLVTLVSLILYDFKPLYQNLDIDDYSEAFVKYNILNAQYNLDYKKYALSQNALQLSIFVKENYSSFEAQIIYIAAYKNNIDFIKNFLTEENLAKIPPEEYLEIYTDLIDNKKFSLLIHLPITDIIINSPLSINSSIFFIKDGGIFLKSLNEHGYKFDFNYIELLSEIFHDYNIIASGYSPENVKQLSTILLNNLYIINQFLPYLLDDLKKEEYLFLKNLLLTILTNSNDQNFHTILFELYTKEELNTKDKNGYSILESLLINSLRMDKYYKIAKYILNKYKVDISNLPIELYSYFIKAAILGDSETVRQILSLKATVKFAITDPKDKKPINFIHYLKNKFGKEFVVENVNIENFYNINAEGKRTSDDATDIVKNLSELLNDKISNVIISKYKSDIKLTADEIIFHTELITNLQQLINSLAKDNIIHKNLLNELTTLQNELQKVVDDINDLKKHGADSTEIIDEKKKQFTSTLKDLKTRSLHTKENIEDVKNKITDGYKDDFLSIIQKATKYKSLFKANLKITTNLKLSELNSTANYDNLSKIELYLPSDNLEQPEYLQLDLLTLIVIANSSSLNITRFLKQLDHKNYSDSVTIYNILNAQHGDGNILNFNATFESIIKNLHKKTSLEHKIFKIALDQENKTLIDAYLAKPVFLTFIESHFLFYDYIKAVNIAKIDLLLTYFKPNMYVLKHAALSALNGGESYNIAKLIYQKSAINIHEASIFAQAFLIGTAIEKDAEMVKDLISNKLSINFDFIHPVTSINVSFIDYLKENFSTEQFESLNISSDNHLPIATNQNGMITIIDNLSEYFDQFTQKDYIISEKDTELKTLASDITSPIASDAAVTHDQSSSPAIDPCKLTMHVAGELES